MSECELIRDTPAEGVLRLTLDRPAVHNAITLAMAEGIESHLAAAAVDDTVKVVVLAGAGDRAFSAGYDMTEMAGHSDEDLISISAHHSELLWRYFSFPKPTIAAVSGSAHGAGTLYAACSDIRVGGPATSFTVTAAKFGGANLTWLLDHLVGAGVARDMLMTSRAITGTSALTCGLITRYADDGDVDTTALGTASELTSKPVRTLIEIKALLNRGPGRGLRERFIDENEVGQTSLRPRGLSSAFSGFLQGKKR